MKTKKFKDQIKLPWRLKGPRFTSYSIQGLKCKEIKS